MQFLLTLSSPTISTIYASRSLQTGADFPCAKQYFYYLLYTSWSCVCIHTYKCAQRRLGRGRYSPLVLPPGRPLANGHAQCSDLGRLLGVGSGQSGLSILSGNSALLAAAWGQLKSQSDINRVIPEYHHKSY